MQSLRRASVLLSRVGKRRAGDVAHGHGGHHDAHHEAGAAWKPPVVSPEIQALREKQKLPWGQLTVDDKTKLYRAAYSQTRLEKMKGDQDGGKVFVGVIIGLAVSYVIFALVQSRAMPVPKTMSKEWKAAEAARAKERGSNPLQPK